MHTKEAIQNANKAANEASSVPLNGANKSQKRNPRGKSPRPIARKQGVKLDGLFALEEPAQRLQIRDVRRQMIETYRTMPDACQKLWGKLFSAECSGDRSRRETFSYSDGLPKCSRPTRTRPLKR